MVKEESLALLKWVLTLGSLLVYADSLAVLRLIYPSKRSWDEAFSGIHLNELGRLATVHDHTFHSAELGLVAEDGSATVVGAGNADLGVDSVDVSAQVLKFRSTV
jgi:hypothetical protein